MTPKETPAGKAGAGIRNEVPLHGDAGAHAGQGPLKVSFFRTALDNVPHPWSGTWSRLVGGMHQDRAPGPHPAGIDAKRYLPAVCGAAFVAGGTRSCANVTSLHLLALDFDNARELPTGELHPSGRPKMTKAPLEQPARLAEVAAELERLQIAALLYSTWSSTPEWPRFRILLPLSAPVAPGDWPHLVGWVLAVSGLQRWLPSIDLPCALDIARLSFLPARRPGSDPVERRIAQGAALVPPPPLELVKYGAPRVELHPWQQAHLARRDSGPSASGTGKCSWARRFKGVDGRLLDLRTLDAVALLEGLGVQVGPGRSWAGGVKHRTGCPWWSEHSHPDREEDGAVLFMESGRWPTWRCAHSHHLHLGLADLLEAAGVLHAA